MHKFATRYGLSPDGTSLTPRAYLCLALLCLCFFLPGLASLPPTDRDESLFAQATKQMIETGDYVDINYLRTPRYKKPVGIYWLQSFAVRALNPQHLDSIWAYRVPSVIGATLAVLMTAALGTLLFDAVTGLLAGIILASCLDLNIEAHLAKTDAALLGSVMVAQYALAYAYQRAAAGWKNAFLFWTALGVGILIKGPIILLVLFSTLFWLRRSEKTLAWFKRLKPIPGLLYLFALITPWFVAISLASHGQFAEASAGHDFLAKIWQGQDRGFVPPGMYVLIFPAMFFPFSLFALLAIPDAWQQRHQPAVRFCLGWIIPAWVVFELSMTKLPHYVLPLYPAIAILTAKIVLDGFPVLMAGQKRWLPIIAVTVWLLVGSIFAIAAAGLPIFIDHTLNPYQIIGSAFLLTTQGTGLLLFLQQKRRDSVAVLVAGALVFAGILLTSTLPGLQRLWVAREIVQEAHKFAPCPNFEIVSAGFEEPSLAFLAGTPTKLVPNGTYAASEMQSDLCRVGVINKPLLAEFLNAAPNAETQPIPVGTPVEGLNSGHGGGMELFFYIMPQKRKATPVYP